MPSLLRSIKTLKRGNLYIVPLALLFSFLLWLYVVVKDKEPFQVQIPIKNIPKGVEVFPKEVLVVGRISEKFFKEKYLNCFKAFLVWDGKRKYAKVKVIPPVPSIFVDIDSVYPPTVEVKREKENLKD